jgi:hypothetical protein
MGDSVTPEEVQASPPVAFSNHVPITAKLERIPIAAVGADAEKIFNKVMAAVRTEHPDKADAFTARCSEYARLPACSDVVRTL